MSHTHLLTQSCERQNVRLAHHYNAVYKLNMYWYWNTTIQYWIMHTKCNTTNNTLCTESPPWPA